MPSEMLRGVPVRVMIRLQALLVWTVLSIPSIAVSLILYFSPSKDEDVKDKDVTTDDVKNVSYPCYHNYTVYYPVYERTRFWVEGVSLVVVGLLGVLGNLLTVAVLARSKNTKFNR